MSRYKVLVDSSVWIDYFRTRDIPYLEHLIKEDLICTNDVILTELIPSLLLQKRKDIVESLLTVENIQLEIDWVIIRQYQLMNIKNGINKVGIPDLLIFQQIIDQRITLFTFDKHFRLLKGLHHFDLVMNRN
ncbi:PIN domain-containing protein [Aquiflexum sp. TKW24L]|uniref:PIN domain-containing protein n=1 Tax=Aquiflexum sp. TKW24L TaxID=2942212 RepID=UPI0020BEF6E4|nr:PIN domain-containing protein [Aquiflexum sp. TKW24L]MCL6259554.1 PIN domain-containing protein [Aquiflexum sp. TKW24L]